jgi:hypothetical protein
MDFIFLLVEGDLGAKQKISISCFFLPSLRRAFLFLSLRKIPLPDRVPSLRIDFVSAFRAVHSFLITAEKKPKLEEYGSSFDRGRRRLCCYRREERIRICASLGFWYVHSLPSIQLGYPLTPRSGSAGIAELLIFHPVFPLHPVLTARNCLLLTRNRSGRHYR